MPDASLPTGEGPRGLTAAEVNDRVACGLVNRPARTDAAEYRQILVRNIFTLFNALVVPAAVALLLLGEYRGAVAVSGLAILNSAMGLIQEVRAKRHLDRLALLAEPSVHVLRDGVAHTIPAGAVVRDDLLLLSAGEPIVADGVVLLGRWLEVDEALLTGESDPVPAPPGRSLLSGSFCVAGEGIYRADRVGNEAHLRQTDREARKYRFHAGPLQYTINRLIEILTGIAVVLCLLYGVLFFVRGFSVTALVEMVAATITSMVPQGLVLMTTLAFVLGAVRLSSRGAIVRRLNAVETMAAVNVLCLDKTGTLTTNRLSLDQVRVLQPQLSDQEVRTLLRRMAFASLDEHSKTIQALRAGLDPAGSLSGVEVLDCLPFKSQNRYSAVRLGGNPTQGTRQSVLVLGACEALEPFLPHGWSQVRDELLATGLRLLMFAGAEIPEGVDLPLFEGRLPALELQPLALVGLSDEVRPDAAETLTALLGEGIHLKVLSGDHADTVHAAVGRLGLPLGREDVVTGPELAAASDPNRLVAERNIFARITPRQKVEIIETLQRQGKRVGMVGDGINDLLAIKRADLGVALGEGSPATRTVAALVLENNRFALLPATLAEGRNLLRNLRRAGKLFLVKNVYTLLLIIAALGVLRLDFPYLPQQVTLLNLLTIGIPAFVLTASRFAGARAGHAHFLREVGWFAVSTGLVVGLAGLTVFLISAHGLGDPVRTQRTVLLATLVLLALGNLPRILGAKGESLSHADRLFLGWIPAAVLVFLGATYWPLAADFFQLTPLGVSHWGLVAAVVVPALLLCVGLDWVKPSAS
jgi:cation-transporting ATPase E